MFCIIKGRLKRYIWPLWPFLKTAYLRGFLYIYYWCPYFFYIYYCLCICSLIHSSVFVLKYSSIPFVFDDPFFVFFAAIVSIRSVFSRSAWFSIQPVFFERPSLCQKNSGWIYTIGIKYKSRDPTIFSSKAKSGASSEPRPMSGEPKGCGLRGFRWRRNKSAGPLFWYFSPLFVK